MSISDDVAEQQPTCGRCYRKNKICDFGTMLVWPDDSLADRGCHGRVHRKPAYCNSISSTDGVPLILTTDFRSGKVYFLNTTVHDIKNHGHLVTNSMSKVTMRVESPFRDLPLISIPQLDGMLMTFYDRVLCGAATVEENATGNPFRAVIVSMAMTSSAVLNALQAVSAKVIALHQPFYHKAALSYHTGALRGLVKTIDQLAKTDEFLLEACILCILLCWFEVGFDLIRITYSLFTRSDLLRYWRDMDQTSYRSIAFARPPNRYPGHAAVYPELPSLSFCNCENRSQYETYGKSHGESRCKGGKHHIFKQHW